MENLWELIGNNCLKKAATMLEGTVPTAETAETVKRLVETAIAIDDLNLRWFAQTQSDAVVSQGRFFSRQEVES